MKFYLPVIIVALLSFGSTAFGLTQEECRDAWKSSSAYQSCGPLWGADKVINGKCGLYVHCKAPDGKEIQNGNIVSTGSNYESHYGVERKKDPHGDRDPRGELNYSGRDLLFSVEEVKQLYNCNGKLKVGSC